MCIKNGVIRRNQMTLGFLSKFLVFILLVPGISGTAYLLYQKKHLKKEIKWKLIHIIDRNELTKLRFTEAETKTLLRWEHDGEFEYAGVMYDVVEKTNEGGIITFLCWMDTQETQLNTKLKAFTEFAFGQNSNSNNTKKRLEDFFKHLYYHSNFKKENSHTTMAHFVNMFFYNFQILGTSIKPESPPPRFQFYC